MTLKKYGDKIPGSDYRVVRLPFPVTAVSKAYIGKVGCACGCGGNYYYADISKAEDWQLTKKDQKSNTKMIKFAYNRVKKLGKMQGIEVLKDHIYSVEGPTRAVRLYLRN